MNKNKRYLEMATMDENKIYLEMISLMNQEYVTHCECRSMYIEFFILGMEHEKEKAKYYLSKKYDLQISYDESVFLVRLPSYLVDKLREYWNRVADVPDELYDLGLKP
jgi:hypothetical protein